MKNIVVFFLLLISAAVQGVPAQKPAAAASPQTAGPTDLILAERFAKLALACVHQEYPSKIAHTLNSDGDVAPPRTLTPAFYGCYDWHSSVHGHWMLARLARKYSSHQPSAVSNQGESKATATAKDPPKQGLNGAPASLPAPAIAREPEFVAKARAALRKSITRENIAVEVAYLNAKGRASFERPYGLAWLLQLGAELREWGKGSQQQSAVSSQQEPNSTATTKEPPQQSLNGASGASSPVGPHAGSQDLGDSTSTPPAKLAGAPATRQEEGALNDSKARTSSKATATASASEEAAPGGDAEAKELAEILRPLEEAAVVRLKTWLPKLSHPLRTGEHSQTAFALGLMLDYAKVTGDKEFERLLVDKALAFYLHDKACPLNYEPGGEDFLSPCLAEADVMRRVLGPVEYGKWLRGFLPVLFTAVSRKGIEPRPWLEPAVVTDPTDGKLAHLDGLNLSRAWMLEGMAAGLDTSGLRPLEQARRGHVNTQAMWKLQGAAKAHRDAGVASVTGKHYEGGHWLGSFAVYLVTQRGIFTTEAQRHGENKTKSK